MKIGVWAPMQVWPDLSYADTRILGDFARKVEDLGFAGLWTYDHLVQGSGMYEVGWLEPLTVLAHASACTTSIDLGTAVMVVPVRQPVVLAKQISTLQFLAEGRFILGAGAGWNPKEFDAVGANVRERGRRTDEVLTIVSRLLAGESVSWNSDYYHFEDIAIEPPLPHPQPIWYGGGSKPAPEGKPPTAMAASVLRRIVASDGWISRGAAPLDMIVEDWRVIREAAAASDRRPPVFAHCNYMHVVESSDRDAVLAEQLHAYRGILGPQANAHSVSPTHFLGTIDELQVQVGRYAEAGVEYLILGVMDYLPEQLDLWARHLLPAFAA